jgi:hypothetical protein
MMPHIEARSLAVTTFDEHLAGKHNHVVFFALAQMAAALISTGAAKGCEDQAIADLATCIRMFLKDLLCEPFAPERVN